MTVSPLRTSNRWVLCLLLFVCEGVKLEYDVFKKKGRSMIPRRREIREKKKNSCYPR